MYILDTGFTSAAGIMNTDICQGITGRQLHGGTTVSGTMVLAHLAGIKIFGTGGLGAHGSPSLSLFV